MRLKIKHMMDKIKERKQSNWKQINVSIVVILAVFVFPFFLLFFMKWLLRWPGEWLWIPEDLSTWFSFYGSYAGVFVTIALGYITLRLTMKLDTLNQKNAELQNRMSIAMNIPNMCCDDIFLYFLDGGDRPYEYIRLFSDRNDYIFAVVMKPAFPPYFGIEIMQMEMRLRNTKDGLGKSQRVHLNHKSYSFTNNEEFRLIINVPREMNEILEQLYVMKSVTTESTDYQLLIGDLWLDFSCQNVLMKKTDKEGDVRFRMHMQIISEGKKQQGKGVSLKLINREFVRME